MLLDVEINKLYNYDFYGKKELKEKLLQSLKSLDLEIESFGVFNLIDQKISSFKTSDEFIQNVNKFNIDHIVKETNQEIQLNNFLTTHFSNNSKYLLSDGSITPDLPAHYKFDQLIAAKLGYKSNNILFVPKWSNTIRIFKNTAELIYFPNNQQIKSLLDLNIENFIVNENIVHDIFDKRINRLPIFHTA